MATLKPITLLGWIWLSLLEGGLSSRIVVNTWAFTNATAAGWKVMKTGGSGIDAVVTGCSVCERERCDGTVGYGGSPDENGETTLDAMVMDGDSADAGSVASLRNIKDAIAVARAVMLHTKHTLLVGSLATDFAEQMGFERTDLHSYKSRDIYRSWKKNNCQPNFWMNVIPNPAVNCGPYQPARKEVTFDHASPRYSQKVREVVNSAAENSARDDTDSDDRNHEEDEREVHLRYNPYVDRHHHDTIGMIAVTDAGSVTVGTSTNGADHKIPGRVGDSPIIGSGGFADSKVGGAVATGDGDVMMRFLPSFLTVELMRQGQSPDVAAAEAVHRIITFYPNFSGAVLAATNKGTVGAACHGFSQFPYSVASDKTKVVIVVNVTCIN